MNTIPTTWPRSLRLLCTCLAAAAGGDDRGGPDPLDLARQMTPEDWDRFSTLAIREHRVAPLVARVLPGLDGVPTQVQDRLTQSTRQNAVTTLAQMAETRQVIAALETTGAAPAVFKGWPLAENLFGQANARHSGDIDIAIAPDRITACCEALGTLGYQPDQGFEREGRIRSSRTLAREGRDLRMVRPTGKVVELHWRLTYYQGWPDLLALPGALVRQDSQAGPVTVLSDQVNMLYLPLHGGLHMWTRLKWLADIAPLARRRGPEGLAEDMDLAARLGIAKPVSIGLRLSARLLGSPLPPGMALGRPTGVERFMLDTITRDDMIPGVSTRYRIWARINAFRLAHGPGQIMGIVRYDTLRRWRWRLADMGMG